MLPLLRPAERIDCVRAQRRSTHMHIVFIFSFYSGSAAAVWRVTLCVCVLFSVARRLRADGANKLRVAEGRLCRNQAASEASSADVASAGVVEPIPAAGHMTTGNSLLARRRVNCTLTVETIDLCFASYCKSFQTTV